jgi:hypothetical protein
MKFMTPHITKSRHRESNFAAPHTEEDMAFSGEPVEDIQMNQAANDNVPESITPSQIATVVQQASPRQNNWDDCKQQLLGKRRRETALDPVDACFKNYMKQQTSDPDAQFLHSLLPDMKSMTAKQKRTFKIGALNLMDEILEDAGSDQPSSTD